MMNDEELDRPDKTITESEALADTKPEAIIEKTMIQTAKRDVPGLHVAQRSDVGAIRTRNEDSCLVFSSESGGHFPLLPFGLYIVADGMGGHEAGHLASKIASRETAHHILKEIYLPLINKDDPPDHDTIIKVMADAVQIAHEAVYNPNPDMDGGTTLTAVLILGQDLFAAHVGDSRAYWLVDGDLQTVTNDHSLVQRLQDEGQLTADEAHDFQYRNVLLRALGQEDELKVDIYQRSLPQKGKLLLCSDGLCGLVMDPELQQIMNMPIPLPETTDRLIAAAMQAGGYDNITAVVVDFCF